MFDTAQPYIASYVIFRNEGKIAFLLRSNTSWMNNYYGLPAGKVEKNETFAAAAIREAKEEVGVTITPESIQHVLTAHRFSRDGLFWVDLIFEAGTWQGDLFNAEPHMHAELAWLDPKNLPENIIASVSYYIEQIEAGATYTEYGWNGEKD